MKTKATMKHWKTQLNILWFGQAILMAMLAMSLPYWPLYIKTLGAYTDSEIMFWSAAIYVAPFISSTFSSPLWGRVGDKHGYKPMVIRACLGLFITQTLILFFSDVVLIFVFRLLQGLLAGFIVAAQSWALAISPSNERGATIGKLQSATAVGNLLGPLLGGAIATIFGYHAIFTSSSLICAFITMLFLFLLDNVKPKAIAENAIATATARIKKNIFSYLEKNLIAILFVIVIVQLARSVITPVFSLFITQELHGSDLTVGVLYAATGLMIFLCAPYWGKYFDTLKQSGTNVYKLIVGLLFFSALLQVMHAYSHHLVSIFILRLLWGIALAGLLPILVSLLLDYIKTSERGLILGFSNSATKFGNLLGILAGATVEVYFGYANSFFFTALLYVFAGIVILLLEKPITLKLNQDLQLEQQA